MSLDLMGIEVFVPDVKWIYNPTIPTTMTQEEIKEGNRLRRKSDILKLYDDWMKEMDERQVDWVNFLGFRGLVVLTYNEFFRKYKVVYLLQQCINGMSHVVAYDNYKKKSKNEIMAELKLMGWS